LKNPTRALDEFVLDYLYRTPAVDLNGIQTIGTNVYEKDWDVLIVLDTAHVDALQIVMDEYDFIEDVNSIWSVGGGRQQSGSRGRSTSSTWIRSGTQRSALHRATCKRFSTRKYNIKKVSHFR
jgi:hypothetical protein